MLGLLAVQVLATLFVDYQGHVMGAKMESALRKELFEHCQTLPFRFYDRTRTGQLMSRITNDLFMLGELYHHGPEDLAIAALKFAGAIAILAYLDLPLTLMIVAIIPFAVMYALHFSGRMNVALTQSKRQVGAINERVEDALAGGEGSAAHYRLAGWRESGTLAGILAAAILPAHATASS